MATKILDPDFVRGALGAVRGALGEQVPVGGLS
jgi:hypothetical protein